MAAAKKATKKAAKKAPAKKASKKATAKQTPAKKTSKKTTKKTSKKTTKKTTGASSVGNVVVTSKVKEAVKASDVRMAGDFPEALNAEVQTIIDKAIGRAKGNDRKTVRPEDL